MEQLHPKILVTQIIGFLIVLWVLKRYAWKPVLGLLEERRAPHRQRCGLGGEALRHEAERIRAEYEEQLKGIEVQARERIQAAVAEGQKVAEEIRANAHREARAITEKAKADLEMEYKKALRRAAPGFGGDVVGRPSGCSRNAWMLPSTASWWIGLGRTAG